MFLNTTIGSSAHVFLICALALVGIIVLSYFVTYLPAKREEERWQRILLNVRSLRKGMRTEDIIKLLGNPHGRSTLKSGVEKLEWRFSEKPVRKINIKFKDHVAFEFSAYNMNMDKFYDEINVTHLPMSTSNQGRTFHDVPCTKKPVVSPGQSVTSRTKQIDQPYGGYLPVKTFSKTELRDDHTLFEQENIHASVVGMAVDYLTRFMMGASIDDAFETSIKGATFAEVSGRTGSKREISSYLSNIKSIDRTSVIAACKAVTFDVWYRNPADALVAKSAHDTNPDPETVSNIQIMVQRSISFWKEYGPIIKDGFTFEPTGYTETVSTGDGDFLTADTMWDFKVLKSNPTSKHTLQLLMYWIMGLHSGKEEFKSIKKLGIYNPRLNKVYLIDTATISRETIKVVEEEVICYK